MFFFSLSEIRAKARQSLTDIPGIFGIAAIPVVLTVLVNLFSQTRHIPSQYELMDMSQGQLIHFAIGNVSFPSLWSLLISFFILSIHFALIQLVRGIKQYTSYKDAVALFNHPQFGNIIATYLLRSILLFLLALIPAIGVCLLLFGLFFLLIASLYQGDSSVALFGLIPMFIGFAMTVGGFLLYFLFYYSYSLTDMVLYDQLDSQTFTGPWPALKESSRLMKGYKQQAFYLDLSLIGWYILNIITLGIAGIYTIPYTGLAHVYFYQAVLDDREKKQLI